MKKLWCVTVNGWTWDRPRTFYAESREAAAEIAERFQAHDPVEYAGNFTDENAARLLEVYQTVCMY